jgi:hypothetical protein
MLARTGQNMHKMVDAIFSTEPRMEALKMWTWNFRMLAQW